MLQNISSGVTTFSLPLTGGIAGVAQIASASADSIPVGTYTVTLSYQNAAGYPAASTTATGVAIIPPPVLTAVTPIASTTTIADAMYHFTTSAACSVLASAPSSTLGSVAVQISSPVPSTDFTAYLTGIQVGGTYSFSFLCQDAYGSDSNTLTVGPFTVIAPYNPGTTSGRYVYPPKVQPSSDAVMPQLPGALFTKNLKRGSVDPDVARLQSYLRTRGFMVVPEGKETTIFGPKTKKQLSLFQKSAGITPDGVLGPLTRGYINSNN